MVADSVQYDGSIGLPHTGLNPVIFPQNPPENLLHAVSISPIDSIQSATQLNGNSARASGFCSFTVILCTILGAAVGAGILFILVFAAKVTFTIGLIASFIAIGSLLGFGVGMIISTQTSTQTEQNVSDPTNATHSDTRLSLFHGKQRILSLCSIGIGIAIIISMVPLMFFATLPTTLWLILAGLVAIAEIAGFVGMLKTFSGEGEILKLISDSAIIVADENIGTPSLSHSNDTVDDVGSNMLSSTLTSTTIDISDQKVGKDEKKSSKSTNSKNSHEINSEPMITVPAMDQPEPLTILPKLIFDMANINWKHLEQLLALQLREIECGINFLNIAINSLSLIEKSRESIKPLIQDVNREIENFQLMRKNIGELIANRNNETQLESLDEANKALLQKEDILNEVNGKIINMQKALKFKLPNFHRNENFDQEKNKENQRDLEHVRQDILLCYMEIIEQQFKDCHPATSESE